jgi:hypothetical protein
MTELRKSGLVTFAIGFLVLLLGAEFALAQVTATVSGRARRIGRCGRWGHGDRQNHRNRLTRAVITDEPATIEFSPYRWAPRRCERPALEPLHARGKSCGNPEAVVICG